MNRLQLIAKNTAVMFTANMASKILAFFYIMYTARYLGAREFGILSFALAVIGVFSIYTDMGLNPYMVREVARDHSLSGIYLKSLTKIKIVFCILTYGFITIFLFALDYPADTVMVTHLMALSLIFNALASISYALFQSFEQMEYVSLGQIINALILLAGTIAAIHLHLSTVSFAALNLLASIITFFYALFALRSKLPQVFHFLTLPISDHNPEITYKDMVRQALPFGLSGLFIGIYYYIDTIMLSLLVPDANQAIGWYNAAYRIVIFLMVIPSAIISALYPILSKSFLSQGKELIFIFERSTKYIISISMPACVGITLLAPQFIHIIYGSNYQGSSICLQILVWSFLFAAIGAIFGNTLNAINRQTSLTVITGIGMICNITLNLVLIPRYSYNGAAWVADLTRLLIIIAEYILLARYAITPPLRSCLKTVFQVFTASLVMGIFIVVAQSIALVWIIIGSVAIYGLAFYLMRGIDEADTILLHRLWARGSNG
jgi:O-antigen/teichoic acid export membrane protein